MFRSLLLLADHVPGVPWHPETFPEALLATGVFGAFGIVLLFAGYKIFDLLLPKLDFEKELAEKNLPVAIVVAALLVSIAIIVTAAGRRERHRTIGMAGRYCFRVRVTTTAAIAIRMLPTNSAGGNRCRCQPPPSATSQPSPIEASQKSSRVG